MLRTFRERAIVLRTYKLGEADRIVVLFGEQSGQIRAVAKGVRRTSSRFGSRLESFNMVDLQCYRGRELHTITQVETLSAYSSVLSGRYDAFTNAKLIVEGAQKIIESHDLPNPEQFALLHGALHALGNGERPATLIASSYLMRALAIEGWHPQISHCALCDSATDNTLFSVSAGGTVCEECSPQDTIEVEPRVIATLEALLLPDWSRALAAPQSLWGDVANLAGVWAQWQLEQRLRALPFAAVSSGI